MVDPKLNKYLRELRERHPGKKFPGFCNTYCSDIYSKKILAVLQDPGRQKNGISRCSIENNDVTSKRQRNTIIKQLGMSPTEILFWNFYPFYNRKKNEKSEETWAKELRILAKKLQNLKVIVVSGTVAWEGMRHFRPILGVSMLWTPHPSPLGINPHGMDNDYERGWRNAKFLIEV